MNKARISICIQISAEVSLSFRWPLVGAMIVVIDLTYLKTKPTDGNGYSMPFQLDRRAVNTANGESLV